MSNSPCRRCKDGFGIISLTLQPVAYLLLLCLFGNTTAVAKPNPPPHRSIKLMTYNIHAWRDSSNCCNFDRIVKVVKEIQPDILCLNEVLHPFARPSPSSSSPASRAEMMIIDDYYQRVQNNQGKDYPVDPSFLPQDEKLSFLHRLAEATGLTNLDFVEATDNSYFGQGVSFGNAILTCHPIVDSRHVLMKVEKGDLELGRQKRDFVDPRSFGAAIVQIDNGQAGHCIVGVAYGHLDHKSEELREKQILTAINKLEPFLKSTPQIICGDFNTFQKSDCDQSAWQAILDLYGNRGWPAPPERSMVLDALINHGYMDTFYCCQQQQQNGSGGSTQEEDAIHLPDPTSWTNNPLMRIDHIFAKEGEATTSKTVTKIVPKRHYRVETDASDHFPVILEALLET